jgi:hypothetical protein
MFSPDYDVFIWIRSLFNCRLVFSDLYYFVPSYVLYANRTRNFNLFSDIEFKISPFQSRKLRVRLLEPLADGVSQPREAEKTTASSCYIG